MLGRVVLGCVLLAGAVAWTFNQWPQQQPIGTATMAHRHAFEKINATLRQISAAQSNCLKVTAAFPPQFSEVTVSGKRVDACVKLTGGTINGAPKKFRASRIADAVHAKSARKHRL